MNLLEDIRPTWLEINLDNLGHNMKVLRENLKEDVLVTAVLKGNAYGHGSIKSAKTFIENGADRLAVATLSEAIELRKAGIKHTPILILGCTPKAQIPLIIKWNLIQTVYDFKFAEKISKEALKGDKEVKVHIKIDTGMGRLGFLVNDETLEEIVNISKLKNLKIEGIYSHLSTSDEKDKTYTDMQYNLFLELIENLERKKIEISIKHISNSGAIIDLPEYNLDMIRAGLILYGLYPSEEVKKEKLALKPAMTLKTTICYVKEVPKGSSISYSREFITKKKTKVATIPIGYGDGIPRKFAKEGKVFIKGKSAPVIGNICMDQLMVDISDIDNVYMGEKVVIFGYDKKHPQVNDIADQLDTINYEIISMIGRRVPRVYIKNDEVVEIEDNLLL